MNAENLMNPQPGSGDAEPAFAAGAADDLANKSGAKGRLWNGLYLKIMAINLLICICTCVFAYALPLYVQNVLGGSKATAGLIMGAFTFASLFMRPIYGNLVDSRGRRFVLLLGISIFTAMSFAYYWTASIAALFVLRTIQGIGGSGHSTSAVVVVTDALPRSRLSEGVGYFGLSSNVAQATAPVLAAALIASMGYGSIFILATAIGVAAIALVLTLDYEKKPGKAPGYRPPQKKDRQPISFRNMFEPSAALGSLTQFFLIMPFGLINSFMPTYAASRGIPHVSWFFTVSAAMMMASRIFFGRVADKKGYCKVIIPGMALMVACMAVLAMMTSVVHMYIGAVLFGTGIGLFNPNMNAFIMKKAPFEKRGLAGSTYYAASDSGVGVGSMLGGALAQVFDFPITFIIFMGFTGVGIVLFMTRLRRQIKECEANWKQEAL